MCNTFGETEPECSVGYVTVSLRPLTVGEEVEWLRRAYPGAAYHRPLRAVVAHATESGRVWLRVEGQLRCAHARLVRRVAL